MIDAYRQLGARLRLARAEAGLTQTELSRLSGVGLNTISLVERAERDVRVSTLLQLAAALGQRLDLSARAETGGDKPAGEGRGYDLDV